MDTLLEEPEERIIFYKVYTLCDEQCNNIILLYSERHMGR
jgi:hypothetical protein